MQVYIPKEVTVVELESAPFKNAVGETKRKFAALNAGC